MASDSFRVKKSLNVSSGGTGSESGDITVNSNKVEFHNGTSASPIVTEAHTQTLTNKTFDASLNTLSNIVDANIKAGAAIAYSKLALTGSIVNADVASGASIAYSKLNLSGSIVNADVAVGAAIAYGKLALSNSIVNADIASGAAIAYSKLNLSGSIVNADVATGAAIARSKMASGTASHVLVNDGSGVMSSEAQLASTRGGTGVSNAGTLTYGSNNITLSTSGATSVTLPASGTLATLAGVETLSNKTFSDAPTVAQIATPSNPSSGFNKIYAKSDGYLYSLDSNGAERKIGSGSGGINYITNFDAESSTTGWATYGDAAQNIPVDGTGGTATGLTFSRSTSSPLRGTASFSLAQTNSTNVQGKGVSYDFTIDSADKAKVLSIEFDYNASSTFVAADGITAPLNDGTTSTTAGNSDIEVFVYDVTNSRLLYVSPQVLTTTGINYKFKGTFQTSIDSTSYRLIFHCAKTSANATGWTFKFDNVSVGPQTAYADDRTVAAVIGGSPSNTYTADNPVIFPTVSKDTHAGYNASTGRYTVPVSGFYNISASVYANYVIDTRMSVYVDGTLNTYIGRAYVANREMAGQVNLYLNAGQIVDIRVNQNWSTTQSAGQFNVTRIGGSSSTDDGRVVAAEMTSIASTSIANTTWTLVPFATVVDDSHGGFSTSSNLYTVPVSGRYRISGMVQYTAIASVSQTRSLAVFKNGSYLMTLGACTATQDIAAPGGSVVRTFNAGDTIGLYTWQNSGGALALSAQTLSSNQAPHYFMVERLSGPAAPAASDSVNAKYFASSNNTVSTTVQINFDTKVYDSHSSVTTGAGAWKFTAPISGKYSLSAFMNNASALSGNVTFTIYKNGSLYELCGSTPSSFGLVSFKTTIPMNAGDYIDVRPATNSYPVYGGGGTLSGGACHVEIERVGS